MRLIAIGLATMLISLPAAALDLIEKLEACALLVPDDKRLECYDRIAREEDRRPWLKDQFSRLAERYEAAVRHLEVGDLSGGIDELQGAFSMVQQAGDWMAPTLATSSQVKSTILSTIQGPLMEEQEVLIACANSWDFACIQRSASDLAATLRFLESLVQTDIDRRR